jgi:hypothetical protein
LQGCRISAAITARRSIVASLASSSAPATIEPLKDEQWSLLLDLVVARWGEQAKQKHHVRSMTAFRASSAQQHDADDGALRVPFTFPLKK